MILLPLVSAVLVWKTISGGFGKTFGILYVEFLDLYEEGPTKTAWMMSSLNIGFVLGSKYNKHS